MNEMRDRIQNVNMSYYVSMKTLEAIHKALDIPMTGINGMQDEDQGEQLDDDIVDETQFD